MPSEGRLPEPAANMALGRIPGGSRACFQSAHTPSGVQAFSSSTTRRQPFLKIS